MSSQLLLTEPNSLNGCRWLWAWGMILETARLPPGGQGGGESGQGDGWQSSLSGCSGPRLPPGGSGLAVTAASPSSMGFPGQAWGLQRSEQKTESEDLEIGMHVLGIPYPIYFASIFLFVCAPKWQPIETPFN